MRALFLVSMILFVSIAVRGELPEDAVKLKQSYTEACEKALKPLNEKYLSELNKLLATHTKAGNLEAALAIKEEITKLQKPEEGAPAAPETVTGDSIREKRLYQELAGSQWKTKWYDMSLTLTPEGEITFSNPRAGNGWRWKVGENEELLVSQPGDKGFRNADLNKEKNQFSIPYGDVAAKVCVRQP